MHKEHLNQFSTSQIIDALPENYPLYKDGGLWQVRTYDFEDVVYFQSVDQSFDDFVKDYAFEVLKGEFGDVPKEVLSTNLACVCGSLPMEIIKSILDGMIGIGGVPSNEEFYEEFDMRVKAALGVDDWINASETMPEPEQLVFAAFVNEYGKGRIIRAIFAPRFTVEDDNDYEAAEYNEEKDEYFLKEGWYERNEFEQINWSVEAEITHWRPLPKHPSL